MPVVHGFSILDMLVGLTITAILGAIAVPAYTSFVDDARVSQAGADILQIQMAVERHFSNNFSYPDSLDAVPGIPREDPWGAAYEYLKIEGTTVNGIKGKQRKDKNQNPLNSDFDLYSRGKDGKTKLPLTTKDARDDIVRAGNGGFVGIAEDH